MSIATSLAGSATVLASGEGEHERDLGPGCAPERPAVPHRAGGVRVRVPEHERAPIPCSTNTGFRTSEIGLVVTNSGSIVGFQPALQTDTGFPIGVLRSINEGASWEFILPTSPDNPPRLTAVDQNMTIDRTTGRIFWMSPGYDFPTLQQPPRLDISDDEGRTWFRGGQPLGFDHVQIFTGPPPAALRHLMRGYPNVLYACMGHKPLKCQKSLDGGMTWGLELDIPFPPELEPIQGPDHTCSAFGLNGVVARNGTVYVGVAPCNRPYIAISHDEGTTWRMSRVADTEIIGWGMVSPGVDRLGNLYAAFVANSNRLPYLAVSRDGGAHWSGALMIAAPSVKEAALPELLADGTGHVAVAYYGSTNISLPFPPMCGFDLGGMGPNPVLSCPGYENEKWNMYITETWDAASRQPLFWSAPLNDPAQPVWYGCSPSEMGVVRVDENFISPNPPGFEGGCQPTVGGPAAGGRIDYYGVNMAPDGTPWVGFGQACPLGLPVPGNPNCPATLTGAPTDALWGMVGRLVRVQEEGEHHDDD
jgi:hypothetical protein